MPDLSLDDSYDDFERVEDAFKERLDESLDPRGPDSLWDLVDALGLQPGATAVDVGCGRGEAAIELVQRYALRVHGFDPVGYAVREATNAANDAGLTEEVTFGLGTAEDIPLPDASVDFLWAKECLMYADLDAAMASFRRVLRPSGRAFVYQVFTGPRMSEAEAEEFWNTGPTARSVRPEDLERAAIGAGLVVKQRVDFGGEWGEYAQEQSGAGGRRLVHAARLLRDPQRFRDEFGDASYEVMLGDSLWHVYRMIGKLHGAAFVLGTAANPDPERPPT